MKIRKGDTSVKLPPIGRLVSVFVDTGTKEMMGELHAVTIVSIQDPMFATEAFGDIAFAAITGYSTKQRLKLYPTPDKACTLKIRYYPPMQEI